MSKRVRKNLGSVGDQAPALTSRQDLQRRLAAGYVTTAKHGARSRDGRRMCALCGDRIIGGQGVCKAENDEAHYSCVPGLGAELQPQDWDPIAEKVFSGASG